MSETELHTDCDTSKHDRFVSEHPFMNRKVFTFSPMQHGQKFVALISNTPMIFRGDTAMQANNEAKKFRRKEVENLWRVKEANIKRANRLREARENK